MIVIHRKEQLDILKNGVKKPIVVIGWETPDKYSRLFCLWPGGVWLRGPGNKRFCRVWSRPPEQRNAAVQRYGETTVSEDDTDDGGAIRGADYNYIEIDGKIETLTLKPRPGSGKSEWL
jgi:hypothetical protein